jgi:peptidoglycan hydrolase CwlO-like protein
MSVPILTIQQIKARQKKYQAMAIIFTAITALAILLATISSFLLADLSRQRLSAVESQNQSSQNDLQTLTQSVDDKQKQIGELKLELKNAQNRFAEGQNTIKALMAKIRTLENELARSTAAQPLQPRESGAQ